MTNPRFICFMGTFMGGGYLIEQGHGALIGFTLACGLWTLLNIFSD